MNKSGISLFLSLRCQLSLAASVSRSAEARAQSRPCPFRSVLRWRRESNALSRSHDTIAERFCWHSPAEADGRFR
uniref:Putative secreted protein n=1 Tax=Ixodes ricinus TaxID=34613 RepID=A0A6B0U3I3_IXORI